MVPEGQGEHPALAPPAPPPPPPHPPKRRKKEKNDNLKKWNPRIIASPGNSLEDMMNYINRYIILKYMTKIKIRRIGLSEKIKIGAKIQVVGRKVKESRK
ncbi:hypothetical protein [Leptospirillum ferriphilum]|nr:hypothetical protein [Leptospirillum ferriphilum]